MDLGSEEGQLAANLLWQYMRSQEARITKLENAVNALLAAKPPSQSKVQGD